MKSETNIQEETPQNQSDNFYRFDAVVGLPTINVNEITLGDSLELCERIPAKTVDLILEDMPYNTTACEWDVKIDLELYWKTRLRILKPTGVMVLTASQPFTTDLIYSNYKMFKYELIWDKGRGFEPQLANIRPMKAHENIILFAQGKTLYNPQKETIRILDFRKATNKLHNKKDGTGQNILASSFDKDREYKDRFPLSVLPFPKNPATEKIHPTEKPVGLFEYLIRTYSNENDLVFDGFGGSGTTAIACHKSKRNFIVIEKEQKYFDLATRRLADERTQLSLL